jgi:hypothetical protein
MLVERECLFDPQAAHGLEAAAIYKRKLAAVRREYSIHTTGMLIFTHPIYLKKGNNVDLQRTCKFDPQSVLNEREALNKNIIICEQNISTL